MSPLQTSLIILVLLLKIGWVWQILNYKNQKQIQSSFTFLFSTCVSLFPWIDSMFGDDKTSWLFQLYLLVFNRSFPLSVLFWRRDSASYFVSNSCQRISLILVGEYNAKKGIFLSPLHSSSSPSVFLSDSSHSVCGLLRPSGPAIKMFFFKKKHLSISLNLLPAYGEPAQGFSKPENFKDVFSSKKWKWKAKVKSFVAWKSQCCRSSMLTVPQG